jgi:acyl-CoA reductase-like NAD-dependent aldehyde dehydrogenase
LASAAVLRPAPCSGAELFNLFLRRGTRRAAHALESGFIQVNQGLGPGIAHSYGGYKMSGIGREWSLEGMLDSFTQRKVVIVNLNY